MEDLIASIQEKLKEVAELRYIDEDCGQLDYYSPNHPVKWPCALIDVANANYSDIGRDRAANAPQNRQLASGLVSIKVANLKLTNSSGNAPKPQQAHARSIWAVIERVHELLHGFRPTDKTGNLMRTNISRTRRDDGVQEYTVLYSFGMTNV